MTNSIIRKARKFGARGSHVILPSDWIDQEVEIRLIGKGTIIKELNWKNIDTRIEEKIEEAKKGY